MQHNSRFLGERGMTTESALDPRTNILAGAKLLSQLYKKHGNWPDAIRAYNGSGDAASAYSKEVYAVAQQMATSAGHPLDAAVPGGATAAGGGAQGGHQTATITVLDKEGKPATRQPLELKWPGAPVPAGGQR
jgi:hypothetical protein